MKNLSSDPLANTPKPQHKWDHKGGKEGDQWQNGHKLLHLPLGLGDVEGEVDLGDVDVDTGEQVEGRRLVEVQLGEPVVPEVINFK